MPKVGAKEFIQNGNTTFVMVDFKRQLCCSTQENTLKHKLGASVALVGRQRFFESAFDC